MAASCKGGVLIVKRWHPHPIVSLFINFGGLMYQLSLRSKSVLLAHLDQKVRLSVISLHSLSHKCSGSTQIICHLIHSFITSDNGVPAFHSEFCGSMRKRRCSVLTVWKLRKQWLCTTWEICRKCTILLASPFVGMIMTRIGLFPVGSPVGMGDCQNEFELYWVQAIHPCWNNLLHNDLYSFQADRALPALWKNESSKEETEDWSTTT